MSAHLEAPAPVGTPAAMRRPRTPPVDSSVPAHAIAIVVGAWLLFGVLVLMYSMMALLLLPFLPLFLFGPVCLVTWAHGYAREASECGPPSA